MTQSLQPKVTFNEGGASSRGPEIPQSPPLEKGGIAQAEGLKYSSGFSLSLKRMYGKTQAEACGYKKWITQSEAYGQGGIA